MSEDAYGNIPMVSFHRDFADSIEVSIFPGMGMCSGKIGGVFDFVSKLSSFYDLFQQFRAVPNPFYSTKWKVFLYILSVIVSINL